MSFLKFLTSGSTGHCEFVSRIILASDSAMSADSAGVIDVDAADRAAEIAAAARADATAAAFAAAAAASGGRKKRGRKSDSGSSATTTLDTKGLREDGAPLTTDPSESEMENTGLCIAEREQPNVDRELQWTRVPTHEDRAQFQATRRAERTVRRFNRSGHGHTAAGFEVDFAPEDDNVRFTAENLLIFCDIRAIVQEAQPRLNAKGGITVRVPHQPQIEQLKVITKIADTDVKLNLPSTTSLWARVSGVHPAFSESDLLGVLAPQGVLEVQREKFSVCESASSSENKRVQRPSNRIRIRFNSEIKSEVVIAHQVFKVTLCPASPLQCLSCCAFGHRAATSPERQSPRCRKCGFGGHQQWQCTGRAKCANCKGPHAANDSKCPVFAVYAKAAQDRFVGKVVAGLDNVSVKESAHMVPGATPVPATAALDGTMPSFASVVGKPPMVALVRATDDGDKIICYLPKPPRVKPATLRPAEPKNPKTKPPKPMSLISSTVEPDHDLLVKTITARVIETVSAKLQTMISDIVSAVVSNAVPQIAQAVAGLLSNASLPTASLGGIPQLNPPQLASTLSTYQSPAT